jgi:hypothetical protein
MGCAGTVAALALAAAGIAVYLHRAHHRDGVPVAAMPPLTVCAAYREGVILLDAVPDVRRRIRLPSHSAAPWEIMRSCLEHGEAGRALIAELAPLSAGAQDALAGIAPVACAVVEGRPAIVHWRESEEGQPLIAWRDTPGADSRTLAGPFPGEEPLGGPVAYAGNRLAFLTQRPGAATRTIHIGAVTRDGDGFACTATAHDLGVRFEHGPYQFLMARREDRSVGVVDGVLFERLDDGAFYSRRLNRSVLSLAPTGAHIVLKADTFDAELMQLDLRFLRYFEIAPIRQYQVGAWTPDGAYYLATSATPVAHLVANGYALPGGDYLFTRWLDVSYMDPLALLVSHDLSLDDWEELLRAATGAAD